VHVSHFNPRTAFNPRSGKIYLCFMQKLLIKNIAWLAGAYETSPGLLAGKQMQQFPILQNAWLAIEDGLIADFGSMEDWPGISDWRELEVMDASGRMIMPCWCDSHTHIVYAGTREDEFNLRLKGATYQEIAERGGGILNSAKKLSQATEDELYQAAMYRLSEMIAQGTGAVEIKSGYGLTTESELKMLKVIRRIKETAGIPVKATFLGAHAFPQDYANDHNGYVKLIINEMIPAIAAEGLADFIDVFCEKGYFTLQHTEHILQAGALHGLKAKVHVNQFNSFGGVALAAKLGALSVDHLEELSEDDLHQLEHNPNLIPVALPGCSLFLSIPYTPARSIIDRGLSLALATDYNPGSAPSGNMNLVAALASVKMKMTIEEVLAAGTINGACAMETDALTGSITPGKLANIIITKPIPSPTFITYAFGSNHVEQVLISGKPYSAQS
jgi:imidazolonepropionase